MSQRDRGVLLIAAAQGDDEALAALVRAYHDRVYRFGLRVCRDGYDADDAVQEAFIKLAKRPELLKDPSALSWLMTVVRNACLRMMRPFLRQRRPLTGQEESFAFQGAAAEPLGPPQRRAKERPRREQRRDVQPQRRAPPQRRGEQQGRRRRHEHRVGHEQQRPLAAHHGQPAGDPRDDLVPPAPEVLAELEQQRKKELDAGAAGSELTTPARAREFLTGTGVHAAAVVKALKKNDAWLADRVYSGVPAGMIGRGQEICIGFMSGASNVNYWLAARDIPSDETLVTEILKAAKAQDHIMTDEEVLAVIRRVRG